ncbi:hypothetical protein [Lysinibacillus parviboronicapiens]|uniref:hypothetical protein n=1 Tax=Lysinibacillus parviboronicapiens TaxID=436516 RepID=UPI0019310426|nr:hypothetical protein [Lysinibacillus parviboronicapiens]
MKKPDFAPNIVLIEITDKHEVKEGWDYNAKTGEFTEPTIPEPLPIEPQPTVEEMQAQTLLNTELLLTMKEIGV